LRPCKCTVTSIYTKLYKERLDLKFWPLWDAERENQGSKFHIKLWSDHIWRCFEEEPQDVKDAIEKKTEVVNEEAIENWRTKTGTLVETSEDLTW